MFIIQFTEDFMCLLMVCIKMHDEVSVYPEAPSVLYASCLQALRNALHYYSYCVIWFHDKRYGYKMGIYIWGALEFSNKVHKRCVNFLLKFETKES